MGASIYYRPIEPKKHRHLGVNSPTGFISSMELAFGGSPWHLGVGEVPILKGMSASFVGAPFGHGDDPYAELIGLIERHAAVEVWPQW